MPKQQEEPRGDPISGLAAFRRASFYVLFSFTWIGEVTLHVGHGWIYPIAQVRIIAIALPYGWFMLWAEKVRRQGYPDSLHYIALLPGVLFWLMLAQWLLSILVRRSKDSLSQGFPLLKIVLPFFSRVFIMRWVEPLALCGLSWRFYTWNRPMTSFCFAVGISMFLIGRFRSMQDMHIDQGITDAILRSY